MGEAHDEDGARDRYYIRTSAAGSDIPRLVVKCEEAFVVADQHGDFPDLAESEFGFYVGGTRFLRSLELAVHGQRPLYLNVAIDLTNPDLQEGETVVLKGRVVRLARRLRLASTELIHELTVESFGPDEHELVLTWHFTVDFADVFEVRGMVRERRGEFLPPSVDGGSLELSYRGLDGVTRVTTLTFDPPPERLTSGFARHRVPLRRGEPVELRLKVAAAEDDLPARGIG